MKNAGRDLTILRSGNRIFWRHADLPADALRWDFTPKEDTARTGNLNWIYAPSESGIRSQIVARFQGAETIVLSDEIRNPQANDANYSGSWLRPADEDGDLVLRQGNNAGDWIEYPIHFTWLLTGNTPHVTIEYGAEVPYGVGQVGQRVIVTVTFLGKPIRSATFSRPGIRPINMLASHSLVRNGNDYTFVFHDVLVLGVGAVTYTAIAEDSTRPRTGTATTRSI